MKNYILDVDYLQKTNAMNEVMMQEASKYVGKKKDALEKFSTMPCFEPWTHITILPNGNIASCFNNYVWETDVSIKNKTLNELWYGPYFEKFRDEISSRKLSKACATCCIWRLFEVQDIRDEIEQYMKNKD